MIRGRDSCSRSGSRSRNSGSCKFLRAGVTLGWLLQALVWAYSPEVSHRHIAGLWKLTPTTSAPNVNHLPRYPIKEFTVYPKDKDKDKQRMTRCNVDSSNNNKKPSILLMLKENGQFEQCPEEASYDSMSPQQRQQSIIPEKLQYHKIADVLDRYSAFGRLRGNWKLIDGKLILAPDRPTNVDDKKSQDAVLEGEVVSFSELGLSDNPALAKKGHHDDGNTNNSSLKRQSEFLMNKDNGKAVLDTHLSVPKGRINVGRFMYPKHHPYFFVTPIYNPLIKGKFELKQLLGSLNTQQWKEDEPLQELFREKDFHGKKFWLTSLPLSPYQPKGKTRWSIKYNKYVGKRIYGTRILNEP
jgi:hypothetical protein